MGAMICRGLFSTSFQNLQAPALPAAASPGPALPGAASPGAASPGPAPPSPPPAPPPAGVGPGDDVVTVWEGESAYQWDLG